MEAPIILTQVRRVGHFFSKQRNWIPYVFVAPFFVTFALFQLYPMIRSIQMSFQEISGFWNPVWEDVGFDHYKEIISNDERFRTALMNFVQYSSISLFTQVPAGFFLAMLLASPFLRGRRFFRVAHFLPSVLPGVTIGVLGYWAFSESRGMVNELQMALGGDKRIQFMALPRYIMAVLTSMAFWQWTGNHAVFFLAGITSIDRTLLEAATIDGAGYFGRIRFVILPLLKPVMAFVTINIAIGSLMMYDVPVLLFADGTTGGGPGGSGWFFIPYIKWQAFDQFRMGYATAIGWLVFFIALIIAIVQLRLYKFGEVES
jgi:ABC-type sugar transport system permease subunit